jgi:hypothetical protein
VGAAALWLAPPGDSSYPSQPGFSIANDRNDKLGRARQQHWTPIEREWRLITGATVCAVSCDQANHRGNGNRRKAYEVRKRTKILKMFGSVLL